MKKKVVYNKRIVSSTPVPEKKGKKGTEMQNEGVEVLGKDDMMDSNTIDELIEERDQLKGYLKGVLEEKTRIEV